MYNMTIWSYHNQAVLDLDAYKMANSTQVALTYRAGISSIGDVTLAKIIAATEELFDHLSKMFQGGYTKGDIANFAFGSEIPNYPLRCVENLSDIKKLYMSVESDLEQIVNRALSEKEE
jgi:hypothetical protein